MQGLFPPRPQELSCVLPVSDRTASATIATILLRSTFCLTFGLVHPTFTVSLACSVRVACFCLPIAARLSAL